ncbi:MAG: hypothetical protein CM15mV47_630 [uncultured marine virus]|nr:MAG: hypothetical protein CM15mV47_630 [uncultured marine virus]
MPPRNHKDWVKKPKIEYVNSLKYSDYSLYEQEQKNIFSKVWVPMCHIRRCETRVITGLHGLLAKEL